MAPPRWSIPRRSPGRSTPGDVPPFREWVIYELHVGTFTPEGTFAAVIPRLPYLKDLGVTAIELMPIAQFPGERNWGYDGVLPLRRAALLRRPRRAAAPRRRLPPARGSRSSSTWSTTTSVPRGTSSTASDRTSPTATAPPGATPSISTVPDSDEVRAFFIDSALMWLEECRVDGFRLDAVHQIFDPQAQPFLAELAAAVHGRARRAGAAGGPHRRERSQRLQAGPAPGSGRLRPRRAVGRRLLPRPRSRSSSARRAPTPATTATSRSWARRCGRRSSTPASTAHPASAASAAPRSRRGATSSSSSCRTTTRSATVPAASGWVTSSPSRGRSSPRRRCSSRPSCRCSSWARSTASRTPSSISPHHGDPDTGRGGARGAARGVRALRRGTTLRPIRRRRDLRALPRAAAPGSGRASTGRCMPSTASC